MVCYMFVVAVCCPWVVLILSFVLSLTFLFFLYFFFFLFFWFSLFFFFFFFSSRRRHTRSTRDWGSDVCSSDLVLHHLRKFEDNNFEKAITNWIPKHHYCLYCQMTTFLVALSSNDIKIR